MNYKANSFTVDATALVGVATASKSADTKRRHIITGIHASYNDDFIGEVVIKVGTTVVATLHVHQQRSATFHIEASVNQAVSVELATGTAITGVGRVTLSGYSI